MKASPLILLLRIAALLCLLIALGLALFEYRQFQARPEANVFPSGEEIAGVPVGGLTREEGAARIRAAYAVPVELRYQEAAIQAQPGELGFQLDLDRMVSQAGLPAGGPKNWSAFWDFCGRERNRRPAKKFPFRPA